VVDDDHERRRDEDAPVRGRRRERPSDPKTWKLRFDASFVRWISKADMHIWPTATAYRVSGRPGRRHARVTGNTVIRPPRKTAAHRCGIAPS